MSEPRSENKPCLPGRVHVLAPDGVCIFCEQDGVTSEWGKESPERPWAVRPEMDCP